MASIRVEDRMSLMTTIRSTKGTHECPQCLGIAYCAMEDGKSSNLCWCMTVEKPYTPETSYEQCMCKHCLTKETK